jgi:hypothetical protein
VIEGFVKKIATRLILNLVSNVVLNGVVASVDKVKAEEKIEEVIV